MTEKDLIKIFNNDFQHGGDCYDEELIQVNWDSLKKTDEADRENGCKIGAKLSPSGTGFVWLCIKDGKLYTNWETKKATTLIEDDGSDYYQNLYNRVKEVSPEILTQKTVFITGFMEKSPTNEITIIEDDCTLFGVRYINPHLILRILQNELPELRFDLRYSKNYPYGPCIRVNNTNCKLELSYDSWLKKTRFSFIVYK
jgi:hypothetical protein